MSTPARDDRTKAELREECRTTLQGFYASSPFLLGVVGLREDTIRILDGNATLACLLGGAPEMSPARDAAGAEAAPRVDPHWAEQCRRSRRTGAPVTFASRHAIPAGVRALSTTVTFLGEDGAGEARYSFVAEDLTARRRAEDELTKLNRVLRALSNSSQALMRAGDEAEYLAAVCRLVVTDCGHAMVWIGYAEHDEARSVRPVASAGFEAGYLDSLQITWADSERGRGPTGTAIRTGRLSMCRNMLTDPQFAPWRAEALRRGYASSVVLPLMSEGEAFGAITIYSRQPDPYTPDELDLLTELAGDLAYGIMSIRTREARRQAEAALRLSERKHATILTTMQTGYWLFDLEGRLLEVNDAYCRMSGHTRAELLHLSVHDLEVGGSPAETARHLADVRERGHDESERRLRRRDGSEFDVDVRSTFLDIDGGRITTFVWDITDRKAMERELRESRERFRVLSEAMPQIVWSANAAGTMDYFNRKAHEYSRGDAGNGAGWNWAAVLHADDLAPTLDAWQRALGSGEPYIIEHRLRRRDGEYRWHLTRGLAVRDRSGRVTRWIGTATDIHDHKRVEERLRESESRFRSAFDDGAVAMALTSQEGRLTRVNPAFCRLTGWKESELAGRTLDELAHPEDAESTRDALDAVARGGRPSLRTEQRYLGKYGRLIWVEASSAPATDAHGRPRYVVTHLQDITERKRAELALQRSAERFRLLSDVSARLLAADDPQAIVNDLCAAVMTHLGCDVFFNFLADAPSHRLRLNACRGIPAEEVRRLTWLDYGVAVCGCVARDGRRIVAEHIPNTPDPRTALVASYGVKAYACHPLRGAEGRVLGTLSFGTRSRATFRESDLEFMRVVTDQVAVAIMRLQANVDLRASEERYRLLVEQAEDGIFVGDARGRFRDVNSAGARMLGLTREEVLARSLADVIDPEDTTRLAAEVGHFTSGEVVRSQGRFRRKDGTRFHGEVVGRQLPDGRLQAILRDVTARERDRQRLGARTAVTQTLADADSLADVAPGILRELGELFAWRAGEFWLVDDGRLRRQSHWVAPGTAPVEPAATAGPLALARDAGLPGRVWATAAPRWVDEPASFAPPAPDPGRESTLAFPILLDQEVLGVVTFALTDAGAPDPELIDTCAVIGSQVGQFIRRKRAEADVARLNRDLRRRVTELETIFDTAPVGLSIADDGQGRHIRGNAALERMLGAPAGGELSQSAPLPLPYRVRADGQELPVEELPMQRAVRGEQVTARRLEILRQDNQEVALLAVAAPLLDETGRPRGAVGAFLDITALEQAQAALRVSEQRYRNLFTTMSECFALHEVICDDRGLPCDFRFLEVNPAFERTTGEAAGNVVGRTVREVLAGAGPLWVDCFARVAQSGVSEEFESFHLEAERWYDVHAFRAEPGRVAVVFVDITERKQAEEEFRQAVASQAYDRLFSMLREFQHGEGLAVNLHRLSLFARNVHLLRGRPGDEAAPAPADGAAPGESRTTAWSRLDIAVREFRSVSCRTLLSIASLLRTVEHEIDLAGAPREERVTADEIRSQTEWLSADVDELMRIVLADGPPDAARSALAVGERIAEHVETLHRKLATAMRQLRLRYTVDLSDAVGLVARSFQAASPGTVIDLADQNPGLRALISPSDLNELLGLLIGNALEAMAGIGAAPVDAPPAIVVRIRDAGRHAVIEVDDTGPGVPPELRGRLFEKGFSTKGGERGLGLAFARDHVAKYGGHLAHDDSYAGGARFRIELVRV